MGVRERGGAEDGAKPPAAPYMRIRVEDFGPVSSGTVDLRPLTIFIGPNNSGKSYMSMLVHSILSAENAVFPPPGASDGRWMPPALIDDLAGEALACAKMYRDRRTLEGLYPLARRVGARLRDLFDDALAGQLAANFGADPPGLVRHGHGSARVSVDGRFSASLSDDIRVAHDARGDPAGPGGLPGGMRGAMSGAVDGPGARATAGRILRVLAAGSRISGAPPASFYLPAARSGLLQGLGVMSADRRAPPPAGTASDFAAQMAGLPRGRFYDLAAMMESEMLGGSIDIGAGGPSPGILYRTAAGAVPLHMASSTVSEVAPILICLKRAAVPGSLLVIEEPEAHLHLANQEAMARYIVRMVRAGLRVLVATHSSAIVDEISTYMSASRASREERAEAGFDHGDWVAPGEVAPYAFEGSFESGYRIRGIRKDPETGIPHEDYVEVLESMFNRSARLEHVVAARRRA